MLFIRKYAGAWIQGVVENHCFCALIKRKLEVCALKGPMWRFQIYKSGNGASPENQRQICVVGRLKQDNFITCIYGRQQSRRQSLRCSGSNHSFMIRVDGYILVLIIMLGNRLTQFREPHHWGILIPSRHDRIRSLLTDVLGTWIIWKTLAKIDRAKFTRQIRRDVKNCIWKSREDVIHHARPFVDRYMRQSYFRITFASISCST